MAPVAAAPPTPTPAPVAAPSKQEESSHYRHYVHERVREKSVRPASEPATLVEQTQPTVQATAMPYPYGYPAAAAAAVPVAYAMPNYPVPVAASPSPANDKERVWVGRTKKQVDEDNAKIAHREGVYKPNEMVPKGARSDQLFWVIETDGSNTLRNFRTIEEDLQPGKWKVDPRYGNAYFVRDKDKKEKK